MKRQILIAIITAAVETLLRLTVLKKRAAKLLVLFILACAIPAQAGQFLPFSGPLTGGTTGALDAIYAGGYSAGGRTYYGTLATGDIAIHSSGGVSGIYCFVIASAPQSESSPTVIVPDYQSQGVPYTGNGAWILTSLRSAGSIEEAAMTVRSISSTPATPSSGYHKLYVKSDGRVYTLNSSGAETEVGKYNLTGTDLDAIFPLTGIMKHIGAGSYGIALQGTDYYAPGGVDVSLADGGTGASLSTPAGNRLMGFDGTDNSTAWINIGANLSYDHNTHTLSATGGEGGSSSFDTLITGTNTSATMTVGTGGTITYSGSGIVNASRFMGVTTVDATEFGYLDGVTSAIQTQLNAKASTSHVHSGTDITTGTIPIGVLPTGTSGATVALGNHTHSDLYAALSHYHSGSDITSGTVGPSYLPANSYSSSGIVSASGSYANMVWKTDASGNPGWRVDATGGTPTFDSIGAGTNTSATMTVGTGGTITYSGSGIVNASRFMGVTTVDATEFGYLDGVTSAIQTQLNAKAASSHTHAAGDVTSGIFDNARINWAEPSAIGGTTPGAGTFTTLSAGASGFGVDADGDVTVKSLTVAKVSGTAGSLRAYEANSTDTSTVGWMGPASISASWDYQFSSTQPAANSIMLFGAPSANISAQTWATLDDTGTNGDASKIWSADKCYDQDALRLALSGGTMSGTLITAASTTTAAGFRLPHGSAPTSPTNGDLWTTTGGLYAYINGSTVGPFGTGSGGMTWPGSAGIAVYGGSSAWGTSLTAPSGAIVGTSDTQTLTNKTLSTGSVVPVTIGIACSDESTALTTGTAKATFRMPHAMTLTAVRASVGTAPVGSTIIVDINEGGSTIMTTNKLSIDASEKTSTTAATAAGITDSALADDAEITIDIDQIGSGTAGAGLKVWLIGTRTL